MALCRRASTRYLLGVSALALMLLAPLATFFVYSQQHSGVADTAKSSPLAAAPANSEGQRRGEWIDAEVFFWTVRYRAFARCAPVAG